MIRLESAVLFAWTTRAFSSVSMNSIKLIQVFLSCLTAHSHHCGMCNMWGRAHLYLSQCWQMCGRYWEDRYYERMWGNDVLTDARKPPCHLILLHDAPKLLAWSNCERTETMYSQLGLVKIGSGEFIFRNLQLLSVYRLKYNLDVCLHFVSWNVSNAAW